MLSFYLSSRFSDYTLICGGERIPVHRNVLVVIPYFDRLFDFPNTSVECELMEIEPRHLKMLLRFTYSSCNGARFDRDPIFAELHLGDAVDILEQTRRFLYRKFNRALERRVRYLLATEKNLDAAHRLLRYLHDRAPSPIERTLREILAIPKGIMLTDRLIYNFDLVRRCEVDLVDTFYDRRRPVDYVCILAWIVLHPDVDHDRVATLERWKNIEDRSVTTVEREVVLSYRRSDVPAVQRLVESLSTLSVVGVVSVWTEEIRALHYDKVCAMKS